MDLPVFHVVYKTSTAFSRDCEQQLKMHGLFLRVGSVLDRQDPVKVVLHLPDGDQVELSGEVVQLVAGQGLAVQFSPDYRGAIEKLTTKVPIQTHVSQEPGISDPEFFAPGQKAPGEVPDTVARSRNLQDQISEMTVAQKRNSALHGRKDMRMLLIRDRNKTIHPFVIKNPAITLDEIEQIAKMPSVNPDVLRTIAKSKEWNRSMTVCRNLVRNPKTPLKEALMLLAKLPKSDVRALAKSSNVRTPIQQAARKKVTG